MEQTRYFFGIYPAIVTPFSRDASEVDYQSLENLAEYLLGAGCDGLVGCGSTGEAATLSIDEYREVLKCIGRVVKGRGVAIAGIGGSDTRRAVEMAEVIRSLDFDAILLTAPAYNKPPQEGIRAHFRAVKNAVGMPIIAYNIPGRAAVNIQPATIARLYDEGIIVGVKEASGSFDQVMDIMAAVDDDFCLLSGEDSLVYACMACGGSGTISASANIIPELMVEIRKGIENREYEKARRAQFAALPIIRAMFLETNPMPVKAALALRGIIKNDSVRLPLVKCTEPTREKIAAVLENAQHAPVRQVNG